MGEEEERNLKALPYVFTWFDKATEAMERLRDREAEDININRMKVLAIHQFVKAVPLLFEGIGTM